MKKSQVSQEYLIIVGFVAVLTIPLLLVYYTYSTETSDRIRAEQIGHVAKKIADAADSVYYLGEPSQTTIKVYIPERIAEASVNGREIVFKVRIGTSVSDIVQISSANMTGTLPASQGLYYIKIKAREDDVEISYK